MIEAVIFDMDGLLIDSEPLWQEAEIEVYGQVGVPLTVEMTSQTIGLRTDEVTRHWHKRFPWKSPSQSEVSRILDETVIKRIIEKGQAKDGVDEAIKVCESLGLPMAIASSSPMELIDAVINKLGIASKIKTKHSAHHEEYGKPHPAVYLKTAKELGIPPEHCVAFEDSANGVISAKAAKMKCIAIPEANSRDDKRFGIADITILSLLDFAPHMLKDW